MRMPEFNVLYTVSPALRIDEPMKYEFRDQGKTIATVVVGKLTEKDAEGGEYQIGLEIHAILEAEDIEDAMSRGRELSEGVLSVMSFCSGVGIPHLETDLAYETTPEIENRSFIQYFGVPHSQVSKGSLDTKTMNTLTVAFDTVADPKTSDRLGRAVRWYRKAARETDMIDRFSSYWLGLEALNPTLEKHYAAKRFKYTCPECGHQWEHQGLSGVKALLENEFDDGIEIFRRLRELRVSIQHSTKTTDVLYLEATELAAPLREAVITGVLAILNLKDLKSVLMKHEITNAIPIRIAVPAIIHGKDPNNLGCPGEDPHLESVDFAELVRAKEDGSIRITGQVKLAARVADGVRLTVSEFRMMGENVTLRSVEVEPPQGVR